ncbi:MAG: glycerophosphodiester phosphodiesterase [Anaeromyxobacteraceae bacterium]
MHDLSRGDPPSGRPLVLGHRGASADAPENTLAAFALAVERGADGVELDVWRCGTGEVVVHHDADTGRTCGEALRLSSASLGALRRLDAGAWKGSRFAGERIPTLAEVLDALPRAVVNVELKSSGLPDLALARVVAAVVCEAGAEERVVASSFDPVLLAAFRLAAPGVPAGLLFSAERGWRARAWAGIAIARPTAVHPHHRLVTAEHAAAWAHRGLAVNTWTVDDPVEARRLAALGVAALITNRPAAVLEALASGGGER